MSHLKRFFSRSNKRNLYGAIRRHVREELGYDLGDNYEEELGQMMALVAGPIKKCPSGMSIAVLTRELNHRVLDQLIPMLCEEIETDMPQTPPPPPRQPDHGETSVEQLRADIERRQQQQQAPPDRPLPQSSAQSANPEHQFETFAAERNRELHQDRPDEPTFADPEVEYSDNVESLWQQERQQRQKGEDIRIKPPDKMPEFVQPGNEKHVLRQAKVFDDNRPASQGHDPRGTMVKPSQESFAAQTPLNQQRVANPHVPAFRREVATQNEAVAHHTLGVAPESEESKLLIPKTSRNIVTNTQMIPITFTIDSRDRDDSRYPNPANYRVDLHTVYKDVVSIELAEAEIPISDYVINESNNLIYFEEVPGEQLVATIPIGNYATDDLALAVEEAMNAASANGVTYTVLNSSCQEKFTIQSDAASPLVFNLIFDGGTEVVGLEHLKKIYPPSSAGPVLGFPKADQTGAFSYLAPNVYNLGGDRYILLHIRQAENMDSTKASVHDAFAKITLDNPLHDVVFYNRHRDNKWIKYFSPALSKLGLLEIRWMRYDGTLVNFNGMEHSLTFEIKSKDITRSQYYS